MLNLGETQTKKKKKAFKLGKQTTKKKKAFKFSKSRRVMLPGFRDNPTGKAPKLDDPAAQPPFFIKGEEADSRDEYWVSLALDRIEELTGWTWEYQVSVDGGRRRRGGQVLDFLLNTPGRKTIIDVRGKYWHTGSRDDLRDVEDVARKRNWRLIGWFTDETPSKETVYQKLKKELYL